MQLCVCTSLIMYFVYDDDNNNNNYKPRIRVITHQNVKYLTKVNIIAVKRLIFFNHVNCAIAVLTHIVCYIFQFVCVPFAGRRRRPIAVEH